MTHAIWERVGRARRPNWYLDRLVALQKRQVHLDLIRRWAPRQPLRAVLKTDLFEEAFGEDQFYLDLFPDSRVGYGMDVAFETARKASHRGADCGLRVAVMDGCRLGFASNSFDLIISNSTLDHFATRQEFLMALAELARTLRRGGLLIIEVDNSSNPLYWVLRIASRMGWTPFPLGYTPSGRQLEQDLAALMLDVLDREWIIHNPRVLSTLLFQVVRRLAGRQADRLIRMMLALFAVLDRLPTRKSTACFFAAAARKA